MHPPQWTCRGYLFHTQEILKWISGDNSKIENLHEYKKLFFFKKLYSNDTNFMHLEEYCLLRVHFND